MNDTSAPIRRPGNVVDTEYGSGTLIHTVYGQHPNAADKRVLEYWPEGTWLVRVPDGDKFKTVIITLPEGEKETNE
jgi:hypothetical protein